MPDSCYNPEIPSRFITRYWLLDARDHTSGTHNCGIKKAWRGQPTSSCGNPAAPTRASSETQRACHSSISQYRASSVQFQPEWLAAGCIPHLISLLFSPSNRRTLACCAVPLKAASAATVSTNPVFPSTRIGFLNSSRPVYPARGSDQIRKDKGQGTKRERHDPSTPSRWHQQVHPLYSRLLLFSLMYLPVVCQIRNGGPHVQSYIVNSHVSFCKGMSSLACVSLAKCDLSSV